MDYYGHLRGSSSNTRQVVMSQLPVPRMDVALVSGQMKVFLVLGGLHLFFSLIWTSSGEQPVYVRCSPSLFLARVKPTAFGNDLPVTTKEVFLGDQCPVTLVYQGFYEFRYHPSDCNIQTEVLPGNRLLFISEITFKSLLSTLEASIPVACIVPCNPAPVRISPGNDANKQGGPPKRSRTAILYIGETTRNLRAMVNFSTLKNHMVHLAPPENSEADIIPKAVIVEGLCARSQNAV